MEAVYKLKVDCGEMGYLQGVFIAKKNHIENIIGKEVCFGDVLWEDHVISGEIKEEEIIFVTDNPYAIKTIKDFDLESGYNPFDYWLCQHCSEAIDPDTGECSECSEKQEVTI